MGPHLPDSDTAVSARSDARHNRQRVVDAALAVFGEKGAAASTAEVAALRHAIRSVLAHAVKVEADHHRFPKSWLFEHRWGGTRGAAQIGGEAIKREEVGGRTTAWVPTRQK